MRQLEKHYQKNFYALDVETTGLKYNHPIQIAVQLFQDGIPKEYYNQYFLPEVKIERKALLIHGLT